MTKSEQLIDRFMQKAASGCSAVYLRALKSDLSRLLTHYLSAEEIDLNVKQTENGYRLNIDIGVKEFYSIGK